MKYTLHIVARLSVLCSLMIPYAAFSQPPALLNYQGRLVDGTNLFNGMINLELSLYSAPVGGSLLYTDATFEAVVDGLYSTYLGDHTAFGNLQTALNNEQVWLQVVVNGVSMSPRERIVSVPYARMVHGMTVGTNRNVTINPGLNPLNPLSLLNLATGYGAVVGGGHENQASGFESVVAGGYINFATTNYAVVSGGFNNLAGGSLAVVGGGEENQATATYSVISGGSGNRAYGWGSTIAGGQANIASGTVSVVSGGVFNRAGGYASVVGGGWVNQAAGNRAVVGGGDGNVATGDYAVVGGGAANRADGGHTVVAGGMSNRTFAAHASVGGGLRNIASNQWSTVGGGRDNQARGDMATIAGGSFNQANATWASVAGGSENVVNGVGSAVGGGYANIAGATYASVPGGYLNAANGNTSLAAGNRAKAIHHGTFVWADSTAADYTSTATNQFLVRAGGGVGINTNNPKATLHVAGEAMIGNNPQPAKFGMQRINTGNAATLFTHPAFNVSMAWSAGTNRALSVSNGSPNYIQASISLMRPGSPSIEFVVRDLPPGIVVHLTNSAASAAIWNVQVGSDAFPEGFTFQGAGFANSINGLVTYWE